MRPIPGSEAFGGGGGGGGGHIVADFVTRLVRPKYLLNKSDRYMYVYIYICVCVCKCMCICMCVYVYVLYNYMHYIFFPHLFLCVYIDLALAVFLLFAIFIQTFLLLNFTLNGHLSRLTPHGHLQVACTLFLVKFKFHTH